ncbi:MAG: DUF1684 domain-containing protein, partial [Flammeovirgaceae bacterium]|nr:DUF1684 domain-containing protein [Flammeovirgaceae bacterium]
ILPEGNSVKEALAFHPDSTSRAFEFGSLRWFVIKRDDQFGVRLRDFESPQLENFHGIERYPVDLSWRIEAQFEYADSSRTIEITNILGQTSPQKSPGTLVFDFNDVEYRLDVIDEGERICL